MFIGINPSYGGDPGCIFYNNSHGETHKYFKKFIDISINVEIDWTHLDLLFLRETSQNVVKALSKNTIGHNFIDEQLKISKNEIKLQISPENPRASTRSTEINFQSLLLI
jgi:hypothetical protein